MNTKIPDLQDWRATVPQRAIMYLIEKHKGGRVWLEGAEVRTNRGSGETRITVFYLTPDSEIRGRTEVFDERGFIAY